jgi:hypothetical protein
VEPEGKPSLTYAPVRTTRRGAAPGIKDIVYSVGLVFALLASKPLGGTGHDLSVEEPHRRAQNYTAERSSSAVTVLAVQRLNGVLFC